MPKKQSQIMLDIILPDHISLNPKGMSDSEASALYELWKDSPPGANSFAVPTTLAHHMNSWKIKGLVDGMSDNMVLTEKGRKLIIEMVTNEPNAFNKKASVPAYSSIKAKKSAINSRKMGKAAGKQVEPFNLRKHKNANKSNKQ